MSAPTPAPGDDRPREGYYPDPSIPGYVRYWNGAAWVPGTSRPAPSDGEPLSPPPGVRPAPAPAAVEETGPHFFDEDPAEEPGPAGAPPGDRPEPAAAWGADRSHQSGFGGDQDRRVSWGSPAAADPRLAHPDGPAGAPDAAIGRPAGAGGALASGTPADGAPSTDGTFVFRRPTAQAATPGVPAAGGPADDGTMTFRPVRDAGAPGASGPQGTFGAPGPAGPGGPAAFGAAGTAGTAAGPQAGGHGPQHRGDAATVVPGPAEPGPAAGFGAPGSGTAFAAPGQAGQAAAAGGAGGPGFAAGKAAATRAAAQAQARTGAAVPAASPSVPPEPAPPSVPHQAAAAPVAPSAAAAATPMSAGPGGGQSSWAQQVHRLAGSADGQPVAPWKPPVEDPFQAAARRQASARPAGLGKRLAARLVDTVVLTAVTAVAAVPLGGKAVDHVQEKIDAARLSGRTVTVWLLDGTTATYLGIVLAVLLLFGVLYEALPTAKWGRTLGKKLCGLQVRDIEAHEPPSFGTALRRWLVYSVPGLLGIGVVGVVWCLFDRPWHQCWHDKAAHTFVAG
ncbi:RDD family protein [Streptomyces sp. NPDC046831]|uniref:RDD family protein n=1 Tax=Streptomyces sp. NPDC046831 TaxID=3154805 RepID=UPI00340EE434